MDKYKKEINASYDKYKKEINSDDTIKIEQLNNSEYKAVIDKNLPYDYVPY